MHLPPPLQVGDIVETITAPDDPSPVQFRPLRTAEADNECDWQLKGCVKRALMRGTLRGTKLTIYLCAPCQQKYAAALAKRRQDLEVSP